MGVSFIVAVISLVLMGLFWSHYVSIKNCADSLWPGCGFSCVTSVNSQTGSTQCAYCVTSDQGSGQR
jgi:hypothetical protein